MILSEERQTRFAHVIIDGIWGDDLVDFSDDDEALRAAKRAIAIFVKQEGDFEERIRQKVLSLKRNVVEGSPEYDTLFKKYYEEEMRKSGG
jgi:hypothetical protein